MPQMHGMLSSITTPCTCLTPAQVGFSIAFTAMAKDANLDESVKGTVMSAFYWGYALSQVGRNALNPTSAHFFEPFRSPIPPLSPTQVPGGWAAQRYGGRITLIISFFLWSLVSMFTPTDARSTAAIMVARVAIGIAQGFIIPSVRPPSAQ